MVIASVLLLVLLGALWLLTRDRAESPSDHARTDSDAPQPEAEWYDSETRVMREGQLVKADEAFFATHSGDIGRMERAIGLQTNRVDRHFLLLQLCAATYRDRSDPSIRAKFLHYARMHMSEFEEIRAPLKRSVGMLPRVPTFQQLATVLVEDGTYDEAIEICERAKAFGLEDGTQSGYDGRIERIRKKAARSPKQKDAARRSQ